MEDLDKKIQSYMTRDLEMEEVFPAPYTEVGARMLQIKTGMIRKRNL